MWHNVAIKEISCGNSTTTIVVASHFLSRPWNKATIVDDVVTVDNGTAVQEVSCSCIVLYNPIPGKPKSVFLGLRSIMSKVSSGKSPSEKVQQNLILNYCCLQEFMSDAQNSVYIYSSESCHRKLINWGEPERAPH